MPDTIHCDLNQARKRTKVTLYVGNLDYKASSKELANALDTCFQIRLEEAVIPKKNGRSSSYDFVTLSWVKASNVEPSDLCKLYSGRIGVNSRPIYFCKLCNRIES